MLKLAGAMRKTVRDSGALDKGLKSLGAEFGRLKTAATLYFTDTNENSKILTESIKNLLRELTTVFTRLSAWSTGSFSAFIGSTVDLFTNLFGTIFDVLDLLEDDKGATVFDSLRLQVDKFTSAMLEARLLIAEIKKEMKIVTDIGSKSAKSPFIGESITDMLPTLKPVFSLLNMRSSLRPAAVALFNRDAAKTNTSSGGVNGGTSIMLEQHNTINGVVPDEMLEKIDERTNMALNDVYEASMTGLGGYVMADFYIQSADGEIFAFHTTTDIDVSYPTRASSIPISSGANVADNLVRMNDMVTLSGVLSGVFNTNLQIVTQDSTPVLHRAPLDYITQLKAKVDARQTFTVFFADGTPPIPTCALENFNIKKPRELDIDSWYVTCSLKQLRVRRRFVRVAEPQIIVTSGQRTGTEQSGDIPTDPQDPESVSRGIARRL